MSFFSKLFHHKDVFDDEEPGSSLAAEEKAEAKAKKAKKAKKSKEKDKEPDRDALWHVLFRGRSEGDRL